MNAQTDMLQETAPWFDAMGAAARKKLNAPENWEWFAAKVLTPTSDILVTGGVPLQGVALKYRWRGVTEQQCVVTEAEIGAMRADYEATTGKCWGCAGGGRVLKSVSVKTGTTFKNCSRCSGTGIAPNAPETVSEMSLKQNAATVDGVEAQSV